VGSKEGLLSAERMRTGYHSLTDAIVHVPVRSGSSPGPVSQEDEVERVRARE